jgi:hypothetical protein
MVEQEGSGSSGSVAAVSVDMDDAAIVSTSPDSSETKSASSATASLNTESSQSVTAPALTAVVKTGESENGEKKEGGTEDENKDKESEEEDKKKKVKPRILRERIHGIYTIQDLEAANFVAEWYKGFRASAPYMIRLVKTYCALSPTYATVLVSVNLLKVVIPSLRLWLRKEFLDQVQDAAEGKQFQHRKLALLVALRLLDLLVGNGLDNLMYVSLLGSRAYTLGTMWIV